MRFTRAAKRGRPGTSVVEATIVSLVFFVLVFGMLDLGLGLFRQTLVSQAARQGARQAAVHGNLAPAGWNGGAWGPNAIDVPATANGIPLVAAVAPFLVGFDLDQTRVKAEWIDGDNDIEHRVRVTVSTTYQPMFAFIFGGRDIPLSASSTMPIAH